MQSPLIMEYPSAVLGKLEIFTAGKQLAEGLT